jgi:cell division septation protein DedD
MRNNETGEFELVVGNRQLLSAFFIVVLLFAVAFAMGYVVGQNTQKSGRTASDTPASTLAAPNAADRPQPLAPVASSATPSTGTAAGEPARPDPNAPPQPTTQPAQGQTPVVEQQPAAAEPSAGTSDLPAGSYWQVMAVAQDTAEAMRQTLKDKGFPVVLTPGPNNLTRVLVGPYTDNALLGRAKTDLENAGIHPLRFKREQ